METPVILVLCISLQYQIPNPFRMASGHDSFLFRGGCVLTLRKLAAKPGNVQPGSASTSPLILRIGSQRLPCNCERCMFNRMNSGPRSPCGNPSGMLPKRSCKVSRLPLRMLGRSTESHQLRICLRGWRWRGWSKSGALPQRLQQHSPSLPGMRSPCSRENCDLAFVFVRTRTAGWFSWMRRARGSVAGA
jgi:hypothetical protein